MMAWKHDGWWWQWPLGAAVLCIVAGGIVVLYILSFICEMIFWSEQ